MSFPVLSKPQDSKFHTVSHEDPAMRSKIEGGYVVSRARYTRTPRRTFTTGFTDISNADKGILQLFWDVKKGGSVSMTWVDPVNSESVTVRFVEPLSFIYTGLGGTHLWTVQFKLEEV